MRLPGSIYCNFYEDCIVGSAHVLSVCRPRKFFNSLTLSDTESYQKDSHQFFVTFYENCCNVEKMSDGRTRKGDKQNYFGR